MATLSQLEAALVNADKAGDMDAARKLAAAVRAARADQANLIPGSVIPETIPKAPEPSIADQAMGTGEAALSVATGATTGMAGMIGGTLKGMAEQILSGKFGTPEAARMVEQSAARGAQALTYEPRTQSGREQTQAAGEVIKNLIPIAGISNTLPPVTQAIRPIAGMARAKTAAVLDRAAIDASKDIPIGQAVQPSSGAARDVSVKPNDSGTFLMAESPSGKVGGTIKGDELHINYADVSENMRGKGEGMKLYQALIDEAHSKGLKVFSDSTVEKSAVNVYDALKRRGYDVKNNVAGVLTDEGGAVYGSGATSPAFEVRPKSSVSTFNPLTTNTAAPTVMQPVQPMTPSALAGVARQAGGGSESAAKVLAEQASPDPAIVKSAQRLGIENDLQPDHVTTNESYRQVSAALKSINPGSALSLAEREGLGRVAERANNLIDEIGGTRDVSALDYDIKARMNDTVTGLEKQAESLYGRLRNEIPAKTLAPANTVLEFVAKRADEMNGAKNLSALEKEIVSKLSPETKPTYALLDDVRKTVGAAARMQGQFKDADAGLAKKLYALITEDQKKVAEHAGMADVWAAAKAAVSVRKGLEDDLTALFGKNLDRSFVGGGQIGLPGAISDLAKGDTSRLTRLLSAIPPDMRQRVVASGLGTALRKASTRGELMDFTGYAKWYEGLRTNRKAYAAIMSNLPLTARKQLAALYDVSKGVSDSLNRRTKTGAINTIKEELLGKDTLVQKLYGAVKDSAIGATVGTAVGSVAGPGIGGAVASILTKSKPRSMAAVDELIVSPEFANLVRTTAGSKQEAAAVKRLASSAKFIRVIRAAQGNVPKLSERERWIFENMRPQPVQQDQRREVQAIK